VPLSYWRLLRTGVAIPLAWYWIRQCRLPAGPLGRFVVGNMNQRHADLTAWGLQHAGPGPHPAALDIGCGGGRTLQRLAEMPGTTVVHGVDYSAASVAVSRKFNSGQVRIQQASVSQLPFPDAAFDLITAVETHYYWPNLPQDLREVHRVLKPGGTFLIIAEAYKGRSFNMLYQGSMKLIGGVYMSPDEHRDLLVQAGFSAVEIFLNDKKGWLCAKARG